MGWASSYIEKLKQGETVQFRPRGNSMQGKISSGQLVTVEPTRFDSDKYFVTDKSGNPIEKGDIVLCKVQGREYLHLVLSASFDVFLIGNNRGGVNGHAGYKQIYGKVIKTE